jgi:hypothetical protein
MPKVKKEECACCYSLNRHVITCSACQTRCCDSCVIQYANGLHSDVKCISCRRIFVPELLREIFGCNFMKEYNRHRTDLVMETEKQRIPYASSVAHVRRKMEETNKVVKDKLEALREVRREAEREYDSAISLHRMWIENYNLLRKETTKKNDKEKTIKCSNSECRGVVVVKHHQHHEEEEGQEGQYDASVVCELCKTETCSNCGVQINTGDEKHNEKHNEKHKCDKSLVATMKLINSTSKPCPGCQASIHKIDGCSQMWCTHCHTTFDFDTGRIDTGRTHNPHYNEWVRSGGAVNETANVQFDPCHAAALTDPLLRSNLMIMIYRSIMGGGTRIEYTMDNKRNEWAVDYVMGKITYNEWQSRVCRSITEYEYTTEINQILRMATNSAQYSFHAIAARPDHAEHRWNDPEREILDSLRKYTNECLASCAKRYQRTGYRLMSDFTVISIGCSVIGSNRGGKLFNTEMGIFHQTFGTYHHIYSEKAHIDLGLFLHSFHDASTLPLRPVPLNRRIANRNNHKIQQRINDEGVAEYYFTNNDNDIVVVIAENNDDDIVVN